MSALSRATASTSRATRHPVCLSRRCKSHTTPISEPRLRFAPSPTGQLHLGGLRTALFNHLVARKGKGKWILRIEDTDQVRSVAGVVESIRQSLDWAGLDYDEGPGGGGSHGPYTQSERVDLYRDHAKRLLDNDQAYECFCSPQMIQGIRDSFAKKGSRKTYDGRCRHLTEEDKARRKKAGHKFIVRYKSTGKTPIMPQDLVFGEVRPHTDTGHGDYDDFVLLKSDGYPTYHLASVVDDHEMRISHVLRGEEWLPSLPKHVALYQAFGWTPPAFAHLPLLVNKDGTKLSKRKGDTVSTEEFKKQGYEPEALLNFLALLGWDPTPSLQDRHGEDLPAHDRVDEQSFYDVFSMPQLIQTFDLAQVSRRKAQVNMAKLDFLNRATLRIWGDRLGESDSKLAQVGKTSIRESWGERGGSKRAGLLKRYQEDLRAIESLKDSPLVEDEEYVEMVFDLELPRITVMKDLAPTTLYFYQRPNYQSQEAVEYFKSGLKRASYEANLRSYAEILENMTQEKDLSIKLCWEAAKDVVVQRKLRARSELMLQLRHALTGRQNGPKVPEIIHTLGLKESLARIQAGIKFAEEAGSLTLPPSRR